MPGGLPVPPPRPHRHACDFSTRRPSSISSDGTLQGPNYQRGSSPLTRRDTEGVEAMALTPVLPGRRSGQR
jgi:hypothetical protein